ncbi:hypothetical protein BT63DRAFT_121171 [Microthyrium microscopicum]|uniref:Uncharacterized protein n=1 Tax=Microthyrium microscopicum TaxID=703497 RepID=A0A6A6TX24_9PEZI|nr:hypothetical protein BT63DRAFT_121171 [Microthyrium microscopicum]
MAVPVGSSIFYASSLVVIALLVLLLLRYYLPLRTTPAYILVPVFLAVALPANLIILVPIDLASNPADNGRPHGIWLPDRALLVAWRISYWLTFALTWLLLPIIGEYVDSGDREPKDKLLYSLRSNGRYHLTVIGAGILGAVYFIIAEGFNFVSLKALVMALAYAWGLILAIYLMGHGLVAVPRRVMRDADTGRRLKKLQSQAPKAYENLMDASDELQSYEQQVDQLKQRQHGGTAKNYSEWINELTDLTSIPESRISIGATLPTSRGAVPQVITPRYLADLTRKLKRARHRQLRYDAEWQDLLTSVIRAQAILDAKPSGRLVFPDSRGYISPIIRFHLHTNVLPVVSYIGAGILSLASVSIIWSELTKYFIPGISLVRVTIIPTSAERVSFFPSQIFAAFWITYMCVCALYSITVLPIWGNRALVYRTTYLESATWYSGQVAKLTVPLAYNFLTFLPKSVRTNTMFYRFLGELVDLTPLGRNFDGFFPILLLIPVLAALFGLYGRIQKAFGFGDWLSEDDEQDQWREGKVLIDRELRERGSHRLGLGLTDSPSRGSFDTDRRALLPAASNRTPIASSRPTRPARSERTRLVSALGDEEEPEGNFFGNFAHRVRNTIDSVERPGWLPDFTSGGRRQASGDEDGNWDWGRVFGGRQTEGRVRL